MLSIGPAGAGLNGRSGGAFIILGVLAEDYYCEGPAASGSGGDGDNSAASRDRGRFPCIQPLNERGLTMLSMRLVDDVVFDVRNHVNENFRRALGIDLVFGVDGHSDFVPPVDNPRGQHTRSSLRHDERVDRVVDGGRRVGSGGAGRCFGVYCAAMWA